MARAGLRRGEVCGLRRSDVHLLLDSQLLGCEVERAHLHVVRREGNPNGAWAKSRRQRVVPLDFLVVQAFDGCEFERLGVARAAESDFVVVSLFREPVGAPMRPDVINELMAAASRRVGLDARSARTSCGTRSAAMSKWAELHLMHHWTTGKRPLPATSPFRLIMISVDERAVMTSDQAIGLAVAIDDAMLHQILLHHMPNRCIGCN